MPISASIVWRSRSSSFDIRVLGADDHVSGVAGNEGATESRTIRDRCARSQAVRGASNGGGIGVKLH